MFVTVPLLFVAGLRWLYRDSFGPAVNEDAAMKLFDTLTHYLRLGMRILGIIGLIVAGVVYLVFRRRFIFETEDAAHRSFYARWPAIGKFENAVATNRLAASAVWAALICAALFLLEWTDFGWVIVMLVGGVAGLILIFRAKPVPAELLNPPTKTESPAPASHVSVSQDLQQVAALKSQGMLSEDEFAQAKSLILAGS